MNYRYLLISLFFILPNAATSQFFSSGDLGIDSVIHRLFTTQENYIVFENSLDSTLLKRHKKDEIRHLFDEIRDMYNRNNNSFILTDFKQYSQTSGSSTSTIYHKTMFLLPYNIFGIDSHSRSYDKPMHSVELKYYILDGHYKFTSIEIENNFCSSNKQEENVNFSEARKLINDSLTVIRIIFPSKGYVNDNYLYTDSVYQRLKGLVDSEIISKEPLNELDTFFFDKKTNLVGISFRGPMPLNSQQMNDAEQYYNNPLVKESVSFYYSNYYKKYCSPEVKVPQFEVFFDLFSSSNLILVALNDSFFIVESRVPLMRNYIHGLFPELITSFSK
jgi:hypothetical protein